MKLLVSTLVLLLGAGPVQADDALLQQSRAAAMALGKALKTELVGAMKQGGPMQAVQVCNLRAPQLSKQISAQQGLQVGRTALKTRNPENRPDQWERKVLEQFEQRKADGESPANMEYFETTRYQGKPAFRYMKAIGTAPLCLGCHGENIAPELRAKISKLYPQDEAVGFRAGDIRGAFSIVKPL